MPKNYRQQRGGSAYMQNFYANTVVGGPAAISQATLQGINNAPMFNPLSTTATVPGNSTGIVPSGLFLSGLQPLNETVGVSQSGGSPSQISTAQLRTECNANGISCYTKSGNFKSRKTLLNQLGMA